MLDPFPDRYPLIRVMQRVRKYQLQSPGGSVIFPLKLPCEVLFGTREDIFKGNNVAGEDKETKCVILILLENS